MLLIIYLMSSCLCVGLAVCHTVQVKDKDSFQAIEVLPAWSQRHDPNCTVGVPRRTPASESHSDWMAYTRFPVNLQISHFTVSAGYSGEQSHSSPASCPGLMSSSFRAKPALVLKLDADFATYQHQLSPKEQVMFSWVAHRGSQGTSSSSGRICSEGSKLSEWFHKAHRYFQEKVQPTGALSTSLSLWKGAHQILRQRKLAVIDSHFICVTKYSQWTRLYYPFHANVEGKVTQLASGGARVWILVWQTLKSISLPGAGVLLFSERQRVLLTSSHMQTGWPCHLGSLLKMQGVGKDLLLKMLTAAMSIL